ncbi:MAG TPA: YciI family protein [Jatrophihabitans sp.]|jgi:uncharacterized protein YciI|nr:YciI family protein [Jatrophihabitans sp.]
MAYYLVRESRGPAWDYSRERREQSGWDAHAAYMDRLAGHGVVVLGGPIGDDDGSDVVLVFEAYDESAVRALLAADPWVGTILSITSIEPWSIWLRTPAMESLLAS